MVVFKVKLHLKLDYYWQKILKTLLYTNLGIAVKQLYRYVLGLKMTLYRTGCSQPVTRPSTKTLPDTVKLL